MEGEREEVIRPHVHQRPPDFSSREVHLQSYASANDPQQLEGHVLQALMSGVSTHEMAEVKPKSPCVSRSSVSRLWQDAGSRLVVDLRSRDLRQHSWCILMRDGIRLSIDQLAAVAIGIDTDGQKHVLDFALGSSESLAVSEELLSRIVGRGFAFTHQLFTVLDDIDALRSAFKGFYPPSVIQRFLRSQGAQHSWKVVETSLRRASAIVQAIA